MTVSNLDVTGTVAERLAAVRARVADAAGRAGRDPGDVTVVVVAKTFDAEAVAAVRDAGAVDIGESRVQELTAKHQVLGDRCRWHLVGRLQRNKVKDVVGRVTLVHSLDRWELAEAIAERAADLGVVQRTLLQVNITDDEDKAGCRPEEAGRLLARVRELPHVACEGLMTIPAMEAEPRTAFAELRALRDELGGRYPEVRHLSMGMTGDYEIAVEEGATVVRVGEAVFGPRTT